MGRKHILFYRSNVFINNTCKVEIHFRLNTKFSTFTNLNVKRGNVKLVQNDVIHRTSNQGVVHNVLVLLLPLVV